MSTYSSNLRLELITTGTQAGTWGNTTNVNLGSLVEQGIAGYATVSVLSAAQAFTANNGATDEARAALIKLTTITTANFAVYAPPVSKQYVIYNSSAYTATIYNSSITGNTTPANPVPPYGGIAIPAGKTMTLWSDGTNFYAQNTYFDSPTINTASLTSPTMTGTPVAPTATAGTNTTQVATTAFVQTGSAPTGAILMWPIASAPNSLWLLCNGAAINRTTYAALFTVLGTTYGVGDGVTTFNVPDFRDKMAIGAGLTYVANSSGGSATTTLATTNLPSHTHTFGGTSLAMNSSATHSHTQAGNTFAYIPGYGLGVNSGGDFGTGGYTTSTVNLDHTHNFSGTTAATGSGTAFTNLPPYIGIYFIIKN